MKRPSAGYFKGQLWNHWWSSYLSIQGVSDKLDTFWSLLIQNEKYSTSVKCIPKPYLLCSISGRIFGNEEMEPIRISKELGK